MPLPTLGDLQQQVNNDRPDAEALLTAKLEGAVGFARNRTGRQFDVLGTEDDPVTLTFRARGKFVRVPDAREIEAVEVAGTEVEGFTTWEQNGFVTHLHLDTCPGETDDVEVTGTFGMGDDLPDDLREAIVEEAANRYYDRETGNSDSAASDEYGPASYSRPPGWSRAVFKSYRVPSDDFALA